MDSKTKVGMARVNMEFREMITSGHRKEIQQLDEQNTMLKQVLLTFQESLQKTVENVLRPLQQVLSNKQMQMQFNQMVKTCRITGQTQLTQMQLNLPQTPATSMQIITTTKSNLHKFRTFCEQIMSPAIIAETVQSQGKVSRDGPPNLEIKMMSLKPNPAEDKTRSEATYYKQEASSQEAPVAMRRKNTRSANR